MTGSYAIPSNDPDDLDSLVEALEDATENDTDKLH